LMTEVLLRRAPRGAIPITLLTEKSFRAWHKRQPARVKNWLKAKDFTAKPGTFCVMPDVSGKTGRVVAGLSDPPSLYDLADLPRQLPSGAYKLDWNGPLAFHEWLSLGWALGAYRFARYKKPKKEMAKLAVSAGSDLAKISRYAGALN